MAAESPAGTPMALNCAIDEKPVVLVSVTAIAADCPLIIVAVAGAAVIVKFEGATIVKGAFDAAGFPLAVTVISPVAAPSGMTNRIVVFVKADTGAAIVPPLWLLMLTCGTAPGTGMKLV